MFSWKLNASMIIQVIYLTQSTPYPVVVHSSLTNHTRAVLGIWDTLLYQILLQQLFSRVAGIGNAKWTSCQICKIVGCACAGNAGNDFPATATNWRQGKPSRYSRRMCNLQFYLSGKSPIRVILLWMGFCVSCYHHMVMVIKYGNQIR